MKLRRIYLTPLLLLVAVMPASAAFDFYIANIFENGTGTISIDNGPFNPFTGSLVSDPSSNIGIPVLTWTFASGGWNAPVPNGDLFIQENGSGVISDIVRFTDGNGRLTGVTATQMIFYSLGGGIDAADTGFPSNAGTGTTFGPVSEALDGTFTFTQGLSTIHGSSPEVPEPATWSLSLIGISLLAVLFRKRAQKV